MQNRVFISYSSKDRGFVATITENLQLMKINIWFDKFEMPSPTDRSYSDEFIRNKLSDGIYSARAVIVLVDDFSLDSRWVQYELSIARERDVQIIPIIHYELSKGLPPDIESLTPLNFRSGFLTALAELCQRLNPNMRTLPRLGVQTALVRGSRNLDTGISFTDHIKKHRWDSDIEDTIICWRYLFIDSKKTTTVEDFVRLAEKIGSQNSIDHVIFGNIAFMLGEPGSQHAVGVSFTPAFCTNRYPPDMEITTGILSIWPANQAPRLNNMITVMVDLGANGSAFIWLAYDGQLHKYTIGNLETPSVLLSESRKMGWHKSVFEWPINNPNHSLLFHRQALANKLGLGEVQIGQVFEQPKSPTAYMLWSMVNKMSESCPPIIPVAPRGALSELWNRFDSREWQHPEASQSSILTAHLGLGGVFLHEVSPKSSTNPIFSAQLRHLCHCAGGRIYEVKEANCRQFLSVSALQDDVVDWMKELSVIECGEDTW